MLVSQVGLAALPGGVVASAGEVDLIAAGLRTYMLAVGYGALVIAALASGLVLGVFILRWWFEFDPHKGHDRETDR